jgi:hypothetical protein
MKIVKFIKSLFSAEIVVSDIRNNPHNIRVMEQEVVSKEKSIHSQLSDYLQAIALRGNELGEPIDLVNCINSTKKVRVKANDKVARKGVVALYVFGAHKYAHMRTAIADKLEHKMGYRPFVLIQEAQG